MILPFPSLWHAQYYGHFCLNTRSRRYMNRRNYVFVKTKTALPISHMHARYLVTLTLHFNKRKKLKIQVCLALQP
jgi:hypothetical protein